MFFPRGASMVLAMNPGPLDPLSWQTPCSRRRRYRDLLLVDGDPIANIKLIEAQR